MYWLELQDLIFLIKCLKDPQDTNNIYQFVNFVNRNTRAGTNCKLNHMFTRLMVTRNFCFTRVVCLWNAIPNGTIDLDLSVNANKIHLRRFFWEHFKHNFNPRDLCTYHYLCPCFNCVY